MYALLFLAVAQQSPLAPQAEQLPPSPIARIEIAPAQPTVVAGDTLRLRARAVDAAGRDVPGATVRFNPAGGRFEGKVDETGLVSSGATGILPVGVVAMVPGTQPVVRRVEVLMVPGPAAWVAVTPAVRRLVAGQRVVLKATSYSAGGDERADPVRWSSSTHAVADVDAAGLLTAVAPGRAVLTADAGTARGTLAVEVVRDEVASLEITPSSPSVKQGDVVRFSAAAKDRNGRAIDGLVPTWTFSPGHGVITPDGEFVAYRAGEYLVTADVGSRRAATTVRVTHRDVRRPLTVVGRLPRTLFTTEEVWVHPDGKHAYLGTGSGGDRMYAIDISDPSNPVVTDSLVANTRRVNDVMTTPDGRFLVHTREGAADRRNGIVIASLEDPAHPKVIAEFTEGVTAGVHSAFVYRDPRHGTHVFLTNNGTGTLHVVNIDDPHHPREVGQWRTQRADAGRSLHDVDVQDGLAYISYWNDGLVILDVGNGVKGGSPSRPQLVSQFRYDLNERYRDVEAVGGPGFIRGTHTAWRHGRYVFIADEVFPAEGPRGARDASSFRAYGDLQVIDVSDLERPTAVAWYRPEYGGVHNVWAAGDTLYLGAYNGGFRVFDISGQLLGDLREQGREIAHLHTADMDGNMANTPMTWGVVVKDGLAYVNDMLNGLWIVRIEPRRELLP